MEERNGEELMAHSGEREPQFVKENIIKGFTYTKQGGIRIDGLVTRRKSNIRDMPADLIIWNTVILSVIKLF